MEAEGLWDLEALLGGEGSTWAEQLQCHREQLRSLDISGSGRLLIRCSDPLTYLSWFLAAHLAKVSVCLGQSQWREREMAQVLAQLGSVWIASDQGWLQWHESPQPQKQQTATPFPNSGPWILIPTGGSSGGIRLAIHTWETLTAAVLGFQTHFDLGPIHSFCVLPLYHVSGLMQALRCLLTGGHLRLSSWKALEQATALPWDPSDYCLSLVPTQLHRLLQSSSRLPQLAHFKTILIGGGPTWPALLQQARDQDLPLSPTYGLTETAAQIATLKPEEFRSGHTSSGRPLPHVHVSIQAPQGQVLAPHQTGLITIQAQSLALGYYPDLWSEPWFQPQDLGYLDQAGYLHVLGRADQLIITGGEKVLATEVEASLRSSGQIEDVCVIGIPDPEWGQQVIALYVPRRPELSAEDLSCYLQDHLSRFKIPKHWISLPALPRSTQGKLNRNQILSIVETYLGSL